MGDFDDGMEAGLWGADGMPYGMDEVDNTAELQKLKALEQSIPKDKGEVSLLQFGIVVVAAILGWGILGIIVFFIFVAGNEPKATAYQEHMSKIYALKDKLGILY